jgi:hypothetical protein
MCNRKAKFDEEGDCLGVFCGFYKGREGKGLTVSGSCELNPRRWCVLLVY